MSEDIFATAVGFRTFAIFDSKSSPIGKTEQTHVSIARLVWVLVKWSVLPVGLKSFILLTTTMFGTIEEFKHADKMSVKGLSVILNF